LTTEVLAALRPRTGGRYADGTVGGGGHAAALLRASAPAGTLLGCDRDGAAVRAARERLAEFEGRFDIRQGSFADLDQWIEAGSCDGVVLDLGASSPQLDWPERGFSFQSDGPLDMRMDPEQELTAAALLNRSGTEELAKIFWEYGGEANSRRIARAIERERETRPLQRTRQLAELIERVSPRGGRRIHPATKVFQALRIAVNDELGALERLLKILPYCLKPGGRAAIISFHSLEDRLVKRAFRQREKFVELTRKPRIAAASEICHNPRARSAKLRAARIPVPEPARAAGHSTAGGKHDT